MSNDKKLTVEDVDALEALTDFADARRLQGVDDPLVSVAREAIAKLRTQLVAAEFDAVWGRRVHGR